MCIYIYTCKCALIASFAFTVLLAWLMHGKQLHFWPTGLPKVPPHRVPRESQGATQVRQGKANGTTHSQEQSEINPNLQPTPMQNPPCADVSEAASSEMILQSLSHAYDVLWFCCNSHGLTGISQQLLTQVGVSESSRVHVLWAEQNKCPSIAGLHPGQDKSPQ